METTDFRRRATEEASQWFATMQETPLAESKREEFARWLAQSARNVQEYLAITSTWRLSSPASIAEPTADELIAAARQHLQTLVETPVPIAATVTVSGPDSAAVDRPGWFQSRLRRPWAAVSVAVAAALVLVSAIGWFRTTLNAIEYRTHDGDRLTASLADGSTVHLNSHTAVRVEFSPGFRDVELLEGEALFEVEKDPLRPFRVRSGSNLIRAVGTAFNVYREENVTTVTVIDGQVDVDNADGSPGNSAELVRLAPRQQAKVASRGKLVARSTVEVDSIVAWTRPILRFSDQPLAQVVTQFNQYSRRPLQLGDAELGEIRISGVFSSADPDSFIEYLRRTEGVEVEEGATRRIVRAPRAAPGATQ